MKKKGLETAVVVAHPDDETLWCGGLVLMNPQRQWRIGALCRAGDADRAPRFSRAAEYYGAQGFMRDLDDEAEQAPLDPRAVQEAIASMLNGAEYDAVVTHSPFGEYTRHRRHEEAGLAVLELWERHSLTIRQLWVFSYEDGLKRHLPRAVENAHWKLLLPEEIWLRKRHVIKDIYGFSEDSFETCTTPRTEAFWVFNSPAQMRQWMIMESRDE